MSIAYYVYIMWEKLVHYLNKFILGNIKELVKQILSKNPFVSTWYQVLSLFP